MCRVIEEYSVHQAQRTIYYNTLQNDDSCIYLVLNMFILFSTVFWFSSSCNILIFVLFNSDKKSCPDAIIIKLYITHAICTIGMWYGIHTCWISFQQTAVKINNRYYKLWDTSESRVEVSR